MQRGVAWAFWARVEQMRGLYQMSRVELSRVSGVRRQTYSSLSTTTRRPRRDIVLALAAAVGLDPDEALQLAGHNPVDIDTVRRTVLAASDLDGERKASLLALLDVYEAEDREAGRIPGRPRRTRLGAVPDVA